MVEGPLLFLSLMGFVLAGPPQGFTVVLSTHRLPNLNDGYSMMVSVLYGGYLLTYFLAEPVRMFFVYIHHKRTFG